MRGTGRRSILRLHRRRALSADEWANFVGEDGTIQNYAALLEAIASKVSGRRADRGPGCCRTRACRHGIEAQLWAACSLQGLEHSLKSELWPLLLGVKKPGSTGEQLLAEYTQLKQQYLECIACCKVRARTHENATTSAARVGSAAGSCGRA